MIIQDSAYGSFQAAAIAAKDCQAPVSSTIQGTRGCIRISVPMNQIESYELIDNQKHSATFDFHEGKHRLSYEFQEFRRMIEEQDFAAADQMLAISLRSAYNLCNSTTEFRVLRVGGSIRVPKDSFHALAVPGSLTRRQLWHISQNAAALIASVTPTLMSTAKTATNGRAFPPKRRR